MDSTERFSDRVKDYVLYRPSYPLAVIDEILYEFKAEQQLIVADIGSGTGISAKLFLERNCTVFGVEPNLQMQKAAINYLKKHKQFTPINATATQTTIPDNVCNIIVCAQALHWFFNTTFTTEAKRILKPNGVIAIIWNDRANTTPFMNAYEQFILDYNIDYTKINHKNISNNNVLELFKDFKVKHSTYTYKQVFNFEALLGRVTSCSYMPNQQHKNFAAMKSALQKLFNLYQQNAKVDFNYTTTLYLCKL